MPAAGTVGAGSYSVSVPSAFPPFFFFYLDRPTSSKQGDLSTTTKTTSKLARKRMHAHYLVVTIFIQDHQTVCHKMTSHGCARTSSRSNTESRSYMIQIQGYREKMCKGSGKARERGQKTKFKQHLSRPLLSTHDLSAKDVSMTLEH